MISKMPDIERVVYMAFHIGLLCRNKKRKKGKHNQMCM